MARAAGNSSAENGPLPTRPAAERDIISASEDAAMTVIYVLTTGGTIEKVYSEQTGQVTNLDNKIDRYLRLLRLPDTEVKTVALMNIDSLNMTDANRATVLANVEALLPQKAPILITHGTDTMVETGLYLQRALPALEVPIVLTGAMAPLGFEGSDALQNLTESLMALRLLSPGIYVVSHNQVFPIANVRKDKTLGRFVPIHEGAI
jgi:L-asparaginase